MNELWQYCNLPHINNPSEYWKQITKPQSRQAKKKAIYFFQSKRFIEKQFRGFHMEDGNFTYLGNVIFVAVPVTAKQGSLPCVPEKQERVTVRHFGPGADKPAVTVHVKTAKVLFM